MMNKKDSIRMLISRYTNAAFNPIKKLFKNKNRDGLLTEQLLVGACKTLESGSPVYATSMLRMREPKKSSSAPTHSTESTIAIILQGPLDVEDHFTLNTVKYYKESLRIDHVILSTWIDEDKEEIDSIRKAGGIIVLSEYPDSPGIGHTNYQLKSMQAGISKALELKADFICKTRTDQRVYNEYAFELMRNLLMLFPATSKCDLKYRLLALGDHFDCMFFPYYIGDFLYFGHREDMKYFLRISFDDRSAKPTFSTYQERIHGMTNAEIYLMKSFIHSAGGNYEDSIKSYWEFVKSSLVLIEKPLIGLYWHKYDDRYCEHRRNASLLVNGAKRGTDIFSFASWLGLYYDQIKYSESYEELLHIRFQDTKIKT